MVKSNSCFLSSEEKKRGIHAIRREEGKEFKIVDGTKVCPLHFRREDIIKSFNGRAYVVTSFPEEKKSSSEKTSSTSEEEIANNDIHVFQLKLS